MKIRSRWLTKVASFLAVFACRLLIWTCRKRFVGKALERTLHVTGSDECYVLCVWHDALLIPTFAAPQWLRKNTCCLVSKHQDGSYLAEAMAWLDFKTVRGSSNRGGAEALRHLVTATSEMHIVVTPDGPRGPRRIMKEGAAFIAAQTGRRLLPGAFVVKNGWRIQGGWTDLLVPMPFTTVYVIVGDPIAIPAGLSRPELARYVAQAQQSMDQLNEDADRMFAGKRLQTPTTQAKAA